MKKKFRQSWIRLLRSEGAPREIAAGLALGVLVAMQPIMGAQMVIVVAIAEALRRLFGWRMSRVAAAAGVWLTNPLTAAPLYGLCWVTGRPLARLVLPDSMLAAEGVRLSWSELASAGPFFAEILTSLVIGGLIWGIPLALIAYRIALVAAERYHARRAERRLRMRMARMSAAA